MKRLAGTDCVSVRIRLLAATDSMPWTKGTGKAFVFVGYPYALHLYPEKNYSG